MSGQLYIDGLDIYASYRAYVADQGYNSFIQWASFKNVSYNDWYEEDGIEPDLSNPVLDSRTFTLRLVGENNRQIQALTTKLNETARHTIVAASIGIRLGNVRFIDANMLKSIDGLWHFELTFIEDAPSLYTMRKPSSTIKPCYDYLLDGQLFSDFGVYILDGSLTSIAQLPARKTNWLYSSSTANGTISGDTNNSHSKDYEAVLRCLMRADTLDELWNNYGALYAQLTSQGAHHIVVKQTQKNYPCYYKTQNVRRFYATGKIWLEFNIVVNVFSTPTAY